ncbi:MAG TPA: CheR family methyltransferase [Kofleriaceae bacterium]|nr:CheR family methyltransferase [Kofleriaceae bacterium]
MTPGAFFREAGHFELLARSVLPALARRRTGDVRLWLAGCASGEEAWSLAMIVEEAELAPELDVALIASDGDARMIARATEAVYGDGAMHGVSAARRQRHFVRGVGPRAGLWRVCASLRDRVDFVELDLLGPWPDRGAFDVVMCHGALAGMAPRTAARLVRRFADALAPGGVMLLGPVRPDSGEMPRLEPYGPAGYRKIA